MLPSQMRPLACGCIQVKSWHVKSTFVWDIESINMVTGVRHTIQGLEAENEILAVAKFARHLVTNYGSELGRKFNVTGFRAGMGGCCKVREMCAACDLHKPVTTEELLELMGLNW